MRFHYTQVFLLAWIAAFWVYHFSTYGRVEGIHERSVRQKYGVEPKWAGLFGMAFFGWTVLILTYFFHYDSVNWIWRLSFLDHTPVKIAAMVILIFSLLVYVLFNLSAGRSIRAAAGTSGDPALVTTGIYRFSRHPAYLSFLAKGLGIFLIVPNLISLLLLAYTFVVTCGHSGEEERRLLKIYGQEYERYRDQVGRFLPKLW